uniref:Translin-associated factor X-interacting protein 1 N-terminal domain-containing protein n=1 Tax=Biomphalaria glabrata TaxID=6526 RepID=A0A2C9K8R8_BIOGL
MTSSGRSTPTPSNRYSPLPPIKSKIDREFIDDLNMFIKAELCKIKTDDEEQKYLVWKAAFNKVIEHVVAYRPILTAIKKEYEDTIEIIKTGQKNADFLHLKLKSMASEPSTLRNYKKRADELEERIVLIKKENEKLEQEIKDMQAVKEEREKRPKTAETPRRQLKTDNRFIPGLTLEEMTDMKVLQKKFEALDRQLKELNISLKTRFLPKTHKVQLKETLDTKVTTRDQLLHQSLVYKAKSQRLKIALEAAQAYNQMKPPHQTVGDAVTLAFHQANGTFQEEKDKLDKEYRDVLAQSNSTEDDDPNKEKEAELMLEYIEKFNELFEDGLFEEAAVHAANSPKGILRTQATLAKFRDVPAKGKGRSPLLAFCDALMSSVKAAGKKPNEALSLDCVEAGLNESRVDMVHHWLAQDRLTFSHKMGIIICDHCTCWLPCVCECQSMGQSIFVRLKEHYDAVLAMLRQGKVQNALQYARHWHCITSDKVNDVLKINDCPQLIIGLLAADVLKRKLLLNITVGSILQGLMDLNKPELIATLIEAISGQKTDHEEATALPLSRAVLLDRSTKPEQWSAIVHFLETAGHHDAALQLFATTYITNIVQQSSIILQNEQGRKGVSFAHTVQTRSDSEEDLSDSTHGTTSRDTSSREISPDPLIPQKSQRESILKKKGYSVNDVQWRKLSPSGKRVSLASTVQSPSPSFARTAEDKHVEIFRPASKISGSVRLIDSDPYTSNPESAGESEAE